VAETAIQIFADLTNRRLVASTKGSAEKKIDQPNPPFHQDKLYFSVQPLIINASGGDSAPYSLPDAANYSVTVLIVKASDGTTLAGPMSSWTVDGTAKAGSIDLNTAAMATAIAATPTGISALIQFQFDDGANVKTTLEQTLAIRRTYITAGTPSELPVASYLTREECIALFVKFSGNPLGASITLRDATDTYDLILKCNTDGSNASDAG
jgi:hypothetical protein